MKQCDEEALRKEHPQWFYDYVLEPVTKFTFALRDVLRRIKGSPKEDLR